MADSADVSVLLLRGCVQDVVTPEVNDHLVKLLAQRGIAVRFSDGEACCGGLALHLGHTDEALESMRSNLEALGWDSGEHVVSTASGCGVPD